MCIEITTFGQPFIYHVTVWSRAVLSCKHALSDPAPAGHGGRGNCTVGCGLHMAVYMYRYMRDRRLQTIQRPTSLACMQLGELLPPLQGIIMPCSYLHTRLVHQSLVFCMCIVIISYIIVMN